MKKTSNIPDFAFPKTAEKDAREALDKALKAQKPVEALRAFMNLDIASTLVSRQTTYPLLQELDSFARTFPAPYSGISDLLEAQIYKQIYESDRRTFDNRTVSPDMASGNPEFWDYRLFADKIYSLTNSALTQREEASATPLRQIETLIESTTSIESFTVYDFIVYKSIEITKALKRDREIPFYTSARPQINPMELVDSLLTLHQKTSPARTTAVLYKTSLLQNPENQEYLWSEIQKANDPEEQTILLTAYFNQFIRYSMDEPEEGEDKGKPAVSHREFYNYVKSLQEKHPKLKESKNLKDILLSMKRKTVTLRYSNITTTTEETIILVENRNLPEVYLLLVKVSDETGGRYTRDELESRLTVIETRKVTTTAAVPFVNKSSEKFLVKEPGTYCVVASLTTHPKDIIGDSKYFFPRRFKVSDIDIFSLENASPKRQNTSEGKENGCFVVNSADGAPIEGVTVKFEQDYYKSGVSEKRTETGRTDKEGFAKTTFDNAVASASYHGSTNSQYFNNYRSTESRKQTQLRFFTDRATYRPGDTVDFMAIAFEIADNKGRLLPNREFKVTLRDFNGVEKDSLLLTTNTSGRIFGSFQLPKDGLLGMWTLSSDYGASMFNVAEYKLPSFFITLDKESADTDSIEFTGTVLTYSGMPLGGLKVDYKINYSPYFFFGDNHNDENYASSVETDMEGNFKIKLPLGNLNPKQYGGTFTIQANAVSSAGETITSPSRNFWLSSDFTLSPSIRSLVEVTSDSIPFIVDVMDRSGKPINKKINYEVKDASGVEVTAGEFESPSLELPALLLPSGRYQFTFRLADDSGKEATSSCILWRKDDMAPPVDTLLWLPQRDLTSDADTVSLRYGCSYPGQHLLCIVSDSNGNASYEWIVSDGRNAHLTISSPKADEKKYVTFVAYRNHRFDVQTVTVTPQAQLETLEIRTETFRSSLKAGETETWKFHITYGGKPLETYAYALLYDTAMDAIATLSWNYRLFTPYYRNMISTSGSSPSWGSDNFQDPYHGVAAVRPTSFSFETYGYSLYPSPYIVHELKLSAAPTSRASNKIMASTDDGIEYCMSMDLAEESVMDSAMITGGAQEEDGGTATETSQEKMRPIELPGAFFRPDLSTKSDGELTLSFEVPDFNTTWRLMLGAYTPFLATDFISLETVASKEVMVKMLPPRFLRTGDKATVTATLYNNSAEPATIEGEFQIFNPYSGEILAVTKKTYEIPASGNRVISVEVDCPDDVNALGLRVYGRKGNSSDGEETVIAVLPASEPVVESEPFYIPAGEKDYSHAVEPLRKDATVTFKYCDNPLWEVVTALPAIVEPDSESLISLVIAFYANSVGKGLMENNEKLRDGLRMIVSGEAGDSLLISNLEKDSELKTVTLNNTPWVNDARSETLRLSKLGTLLDIKTADATNLGLWNRILALRNADGGWSWCKDMKSSPWMTQGVLINVGLLKGAGYLPALPSLDEAVKDGVEFVDGSYVDDYYKIKGDKSYFYLSMLPYLYTRSFFADEAPSFSMKKITKEALDYLEKNWKQLSIFDKATAAITLYRNGRPVPARTILESLKEYASEDKTKGIWFDNLESTWGGAGKLLTTARVLSAFQEIEPGSHMIDGMRQWLLLQKQAQDWQEGLWAVDAIDALLRTGSDWTGNDRLPEITVGGEKIAADRISALTGSVTCNVNTSTLRGKPELTIKRYSNSPAWGGIVVQYVEDMEKVKAAKIADLSIEKEVWKIVDTPDGEKAEKTTSLRVGDKVRITMIVDCGKDMDYVALTDQRPACLEPANQLSTYSIIDGLWCYRETRNSATNIFFDFLPKGRHIISYECSVMEEGEFASGVATLQCQYSPLLTAHSTGCILKVKGN